MLNDYASRYAAPDKSEKNITKLTESYVNAIIESTIPEALRREEIAYELTQDARMQRLKAAIKRGYMGYGDDVLK